MQTTSNYGLKIYESGDFFNPLTVNNPNFNQIDTDMKEISDRSIGHATEIVSGGVHAITLIDTNCKTFKFVATGNFSAGETFTINGIQTSAFLPSGEYLGNNAFVTGAVVICSLNADNSAITVYVPQGTVAVASDSEKLGGELPSYYASKSYADGIKNTADSASGLATQNASDIVSVNNRVTDLITLSSNEKLIGYDIDGEPIYERSFLEDYDNSHSSDVVLDAQLNTSYVKRVKSMEGTYYSNGRWESMPFDSVTSNFTSTDAVCLRLTANGLILHPYNHTIHAYNVTIRYTKN